MPGAIYVKGSKNRKIAANGARVDATYTSIQKTCSDDCALKNEGCYAKTGYVAITNNRLNKQAQDMSTLDIARAEAKAIDESYKGGPVPENTLLRLHVSGDSRTVKGSRLINSAAGRWIKRSNYTGKIWSYTHSWRNVHANNWSNVSMLASVDHISEVRQAKKMGYAPAIVVSHFDGDKAFTLKGSDTKWIPCPAQTRHVACSDCQLCAKSEYLTKSNHGIAFAAHGSGAGKIKKRLNVIQ